MLKTVNKQLLKIIFALLVVSIFATIGCGGGGGGSGRQILPGENPTGPVITPGTGTGTDDDGDTDDDTDDTVTTVEEKLAAGWDAMDVMKFSEAILYFENILNDTSATTEQRKQAYNGLGWAKVKNYRTTAGKSDFIAAGNIKESLLGYAMVLIQEGQDSGIRQAVQILETDLGLVTPTAPLPTDVTHPIGVSAADAHAMLAYAYFWRGDAGDNDKAIAQINAARDVDASETSSVAQIYKTLEQAGLFTN